MRRFKTMTCPTCGLVFKNLNNDKYCSYKCARNRVEQHICKRCGKEFTGIPHRWYCDECKIEVNKKRHKEAYSKWYDENAERVREEKEAEKAKQRAEENKRAFEEMRFDFSIRR